MTELVGKKENEKLKLTQDKFEKTYSSVPDAKTQKGIGNMQPLKHQNDRMKFNHNNSQSFRMQRVAEDPKKTYSQQLEK